MHIEWLIIADAAQVIGNKLYLMGGGWDTLAVNAPLPVQQRCTLAVALCVPWNETNQRHQVELEVQSEDGKVLAQVGGQMEAGRPPGLPIGHEQRLQFVVDLILTLETAGTYAVIARIEGREDKRIRFNVVQATSGQMH